MRRPLAALGILVYVGLIAISIDTNKPWFLLGIVAFGIWAMGDDIPDDDERAPKDGRDGRDGDA